MTVLGWRLRNWGLSKGIFRLEADDMRVFMHSIKLEVEHVGTVEWQS